MGTGIGRIVLRNKKREREEKVFERGLNLVFRMVGLSGDVLVSARIVVMTLTYRVVNTLI